MGVLPGSDFVETSGAKLANEGLAGAKKHLDTILNAGGGVFFIDEAYQLTDKHHFGGSTVLDFLLTEIENLRGKVVFIFAGYVKPQITWTFTSIYQLQEFVKLISQLIVGRISADHLSLTSSRCRTPPMPVQPQTLTRAACWWTDIMMDGARHNPH